MVLAGSCSEALYPRQCAAVQQQNIKEIDGCITMSTIVLQVLLSGVNTVLDELAPD